MGLVEYIQQLRQYGYTQQQIEQYLSQQGYDVQTIRQSMSEAGISAPKKTIWIALAVVLLAFAGIGGYVFLFPEPQPVDVSASIINIPEPGKEIQVQVDVSSPKEQDVRLVLEVIREDSGVLMNAKREGLGKVSETTKTVSLILPSRAQPGTYRVKVTAKAGDQTTIAGAKFTIEEPSVTEPTVIQENVTQAENITTVQENITVNETKLPEPPSRPITIDEIRELAAKDLDSAQKQCTSHDLPDSCFNAVAHVAKKSVLCESIKASLTRDSCYSGFALEGDYSVCSKITSEALRKSCESLKAFNEEQVVQ